MKAHQLSTVNMTAKSVSSANPCFTVNRANLPSEFTIWVKQNNAFPEGTKFSYLRDITERLPVPHLHFNISPMRGSLKTTFCCHMPRKKIACWSDKQYIIIIAKSNTGSYLLPSGKLLECSQISVFCLWALARLFQMLRMFS